MRKYQSQHGTAHFQVAFFPYVIRVCEEAHRKFEHFIERMRGTGDFSHSVPQNRLFLLKLRDATFVCSDQLGIAFDLNQTLKEVLDVSV
ncbi:hypothetical protein [Phaeobacter sp. J2-8]|uniref:hypothetical protein n=1 Tax=Phaeobacter sp. J2-8 TaxID=2931394 RepID=UPI001FCF8451|nr:hypothetical protein [Phaeobacter sp. J2-8]MCJ7871517.1 hypothetical protein [Phaeobacter sp. J2-8]